MVTGRLRLLAAVHSSPMIHRSPLWTASAAWRPVMAALVLLVTVTGGAGFVAAHDALPGDRLYVMKLAGEEMRERMTISSERRFVVQAAHASRRLEETERLLEMQGLAGEDRAELVRKAMNRYQDQLFVMNEIAVRFEADPKRPKRAIEALHAAASMVDRHVQLMESATRAETAVAAMVLDPANAAITIEADMFTAIPADDGGMEGRYDRGGEMSERLKRLRAELEVRRKAEATGIGGGPTDEPSVPADDGGDDDDRGAVLDAETDLQVSYGKALEIVPQM